MLRRKVSQDKLRSRKKSVRAGNSLYAIDVKRFDKKRRDIAKVIKGIYLEEINQINHMPSHPISYSEKKKIREAYRSILKCAD